MEPWVSHYRGECDACGTQHYPLSIRLSLLPLAYPRLGQITPNHHVHESSVMRLLKNHCPSNKSGYGRGKIIRSDRCPDFRLKIRWKRLLILRWASPPSRRCLTRPHCVLLSLRGPHRPAAAELLLWLFVAHWTEGGGGGVIRDPNTNSFQLINFFH